MTQDTTYNGWTNYATWRVNLEIFDGGTWDIEPDLDVYDLSLNLKDSATDFVCDSAPEGLARDYALAFLSDVNWHEIAKHMIDNAKEDA